MGIGGSGQLVVVEESVELAHHPLEHLVLANHPPRLAEAVVLVDLVVPEGQLAVPLVQHQLRYLVREQSVARAVLVPTRLLLDEDPQNRIQVGYLLPPLPLRPSQQPPHPREPLRHLLQALQRAQAHCFVLPRAHEVLLQQPEGPLALPLCLLLASLHSLKTLPVLLLHRRPLPPGEGKEEVGGVFEEGLQSSLKDGVMERPADVEILLEGEVEDDLNLLKGEFLAELGGGLGEDPEGEVDICENLLVQQAVDELKVLPAGADHQEDAVVAGAEEVEKGGGVVEARPPAEGEAGEAEGVIEEGGFVGNCEEVGAEVVAVTEEGVEEDELEGGELTVGEVGEAEAAEGLQQAVVVVAEGFLVARCLALYVLTPQSRQRAEEDVAAA